MADMEDFGDGQIDSCFVVSTDLILLVLTFSFTFYTNPVWEAQLWRTPTFTNS